MGAHQDMLNPREMKRAGGNTIQWDNKEMKQKEQLIANFLALGLDPLLFTAGKSGKIPYGRIKKYFRDGGTLPGGGNDDQNKPGKPETLQFFYHPDHLGSSSFITDISGEVYQHIQYFPFGETFVEERTGTKYTPYLYNGKELDEETGLYYYHARYYDPRISMFYGVDVLAEKYIGISSYAYVANNPLIYVDPDGMRITGYTVDEQGKIEYADNTGGNEYDVIFNKQDYDEGRRVYDETGNENGIKISKGIIQSEKPQRLTIHDIEGHSTGEVIFNHKYEVVSDVEAIKVFNFLDKYTKVEWSNSLMEHSNGVRKNFLMTSHERGTITNSYSRISFDVRTGYRLLRHDHNHPDGDPSPSPSDLLFKNYFPNANFRIRAGGRYHPY